MTLFMALAAFLAITTVFCQENAIQIDLEHRVNGLTFTPRGTVMVNTLKTASWSSKDAEQSEINGKEFQALLDDGKMYALRAKVKGQPEIVMASVPANVLAASGFKDNVAFHLTEKGQLLGLEYSVHGQSQCEVDTVLDAPAKVSFSSQFEVVHNFEGPTVPKNAKASAAAPPGIKAIVKEGEDDPASHSFLRKYWYIILPVVLFTFLGGNPEQPAAAQR